MAALPLSSVVTVPRTALSQRPEWRRDTPLDPRCRHTRTRMVGQPHGNRLVGKDRSVRRRGDLERRGLRRVSGRRRQWCDRGRPSPQRPQRPDRASTASSDHSPPRSLSAAGIIATHPPNAPHRGDHLHAHGPGRPPAVFDLGLSAWGAARLSAAAIRSSGRSSAVTTSCGASSICSRNGRIGSCRSLAGAASAKRVSPWRS